MRARVTHDMHERRVVSHSRARPTLWQDVPKFQRRFFSVLDDPVVGPAISYTSGDVDGSGEKKEKKKKTIKDDEVRPPLSHARVHVCGASREKRFLKISRRFFEDSSKIPHSYPHPTPTPHPYPHLTPPQPYSGSRKRRRSLSPLSSRSRSSVSCVTSFGSTRLAGSGRSPSAPRPRPSSKNGSTGYRFC